MPRTAPLLTALALAALCDMTAAAENLPPRPDGTPGTLRGVMIENVHATGAILTNSITGLPGFDAEDISLSGIRIDTEEPGQAEWITRTVPEQEKSYPEARMFGRLPAYGFYCRHVKGLRLRDLDLRASEAEPRPAIVCDDVKELDIDRLHASPPASGAEAVKLINSRRSNPL